MPPIGRNGSSPGSSGLPSRAHPLTTSVVKPTGSISLRNGNGTSQNGESKSKKEETNYLTVFTFHGVTLEQKTGSNNAIGECPFCTKVKLHINKDNGLWDCKSCGMSGNPIKFIRELYNISTKDDKDLSALAYDRKLLSTRTLVNWGIRKSPLTNEWLVPGYDIKGTNICNLYKYTYDIMKKKYRLFSTPTMKQQLCGTHLYDKAKPDVMICEGLWDGTALHELLRKCKRTDGGGIQLTDNEGESLYKQTNVLVIPGANTFYDQWAELLGDKRVYLMTHNDHPFKHKTTGKDVEGASIIGTKRICKVLASSTVRPLEVYYNKWGTEGYNVDLPSGYDVRDCLNHTYDPKKRASQLGGLLLQLAPVPEAWLEGKPKDDKNKILDIKPKHCTTWAEMVEAWKKALYWPNPGTGLDHALACMLASIISTMSRGDQLWMRIISMASSGKSTLCDALCVASKYVVHKSTMTGFTSGYRETNDTNEDNSLLSQVLKMTMITKDGDTLLSSEKIDEILSQARQIYDRNFSAFFKNKASRDYKNLSMTWIICGTNSLRSLDKSELGERFLTCEMMNAIDINIEREVARKAVKQALADLGVELDEDMEHSQSEELTEAMQLTGGYVNYLRENADTILDGIKQKLNKKQEDLIIDLGIFVAYIRARPNKQQEKSEREFSARLNKQFLRLSGCMAAVLNRPSIDDEVMKRVRQVGIDTAGGTSLDICRKLYPEGNKGLEMHALEAVIPIGHVELLKLIRFMTRIGILEAFIPEGKSQLTRPRYRMTEYLRMLYKRVMIDTEM